MPKITIIQGLPFVEVEIQANNKILILTRVLLDSGPSDSVFKTDDLETIGIFQAGWQYRITGNLYSTLRANAALYDFNDVKEIGQITADRNMLSVYALRAGYDSPIGPLELSVMYSDQTKKLMGYLNIGFHF